MYAVLRMWSVVTVESWSFLWVAVEWASGYSAGDECVEEVRVVGAW